MTHRGIVLVLALLTVLAGCSAGPQNRRVTASGSPATLPQATLSETGLTQTTATNRTLETRVETTLSGDVAVQSIVEVNATTPTRTYRRDDGVVVGLVSAPAVQPIENRPQYRDPLATLTPTEQVAYAQSVHDVTELGEGTTDGNVTLLGSETELMTFEGTVDGDAVTVFLSRARDGNDFVTVVVVVPEGTTIDVERVVGGVEH